jgi:hypothetical protein
MIVVETVNFQCGSCGKLMAVGTAGLGQQVRCPHCQQIVLAPAQAAGVQSSILAPEAESPATSEPPTMISLIAPPPASEVESIFSPEEMNSDALFGGPVRGLVEMPPPTEHLPDASAPPIPAPAETTLTYLPNDPRGGATAIAGDVDPATFSLNFSGPTRQESAPAAVEDNLLAQAIPKPQIRPPTDKGGWVLALLVVPLISYSILATIAVVYLRFFQQPVSNQPHPMEMIPDLEGENPGVKPGKKKVSVNFRGRQELDLPEKLRTKLGQKIQIGDLEVTPLSVEFRPIEFISLGYKPVRSETDCLVLNLRLKNTSKEFAFYPLDPFFERRWEEVKGQTKVGMPFTYLTVGKSRYYGGPIRSGEREEHRESIKDQHLDRELQPGESMYTFICTSPDDLVKEAVEQATGPMLWRVQVRRGLVQTPNRGELPATAVVGVEFSSKEISIGRAGG